jgi:hypothetical protein
LKVSSEPASNRIALTFDDESELRAFVTVAQSQGAFLLELAEPPILFASYEIHLRLTGGFDLQIEASVVQLFPGAATQSAVFELAPLSRGWELELERKLRQAGAPDEMTNDSSEMTGVPPIVRIRQLNVRERMHLASKADRTERAVLLRDASPQVLLALVTNPQITADDIVQIIRNPQVSPGVLDRITRENRWLANTEIQKALVRNPKTPSPIALRLVDSLPTEELRKLAKIQSGLREDLRKAALRAYLKRRPA